jgi:hypothetical protein
MPGFYLSLPRPRRLYACHGCDVPHPTAVDGQQEPAIGAFFDEMEILIAGSYIDTLADVSGRYRLGRPARDRV